MSAEVTSQNPFTVTYKIRPEAQWTDNAPIAADDFWYLWRQMVSQPGVVDPAGYDLITGVQSVEGGKQAVVTFSQPYPAWRELFNDILPAHIVKDVPGGFPAGLVRALPVTGGQFRVENIDPQRDEILLARNDRYWGPPAKPDLMLFRRGGAPAALADSIRNGDTQVAQVHGGAAAFAQLSAIPDVRTARIVTPRVMQLTLRAQQPKLADPQVRKAILGLLDVDLLASVGAGSDNTVTLAQAQVRSPSDPGYVPTAPPAITQEASARTVGRRRLRNRAAETTTPIDPGTPAPEVTRGRITKDGEPLSLVLGVAANDPTSVAVANTAADQLRNVGIAASVLALDPPVLYGEALIEQPGGRCRRLASGRWRSGDGAGLTLRLPGAGGDSGIDRRADADAAATARPRVRRHRDAHDDRDTDHHDTRRPSPISWCRRRRTSPASVTAAFSRGSTRPWTARRISATSSTRSSPGCGTCRRCCRFCRTPRSSRPGRACRTSACPGQFRWESSASRELGEVTAVGPQCSAPPSPQGGGRLADAPRTQLAATRWRCSASSRSGRRRCQTQLCLRKHAPRTDR